MNADLVLLTWGLVVLWQSLAQVTWRQRESHSVSSGSAVLSGWVEAVEQANQRIRVIV
jgi:hypothetical protein